MGPGCEREPRAARVELAELAGHDHLALQPKRLLVETDRLFDVIDVENRVSKLHDRTVRSACRRVLNFSDKSGRASERNRHRCIQAVAQLAREPARRRTSKRRRLARKMRLIGVAEAQSATASSSTPNSASELRAKFHGSARRKHNRAQAPRATVETRYVTVANGSRRARCTRSVRRSTLAVASDSRQSFRRVNPSQ